LAHRYIDAVLDGFILALARAVRGVPGAGARTANLVRSFADRFVAPGVRRSPREQIERFVEFLCHHVVELPDPPADLDASTAAAPLAARSSAAANASTAA